jgi:hypothetical protein
LLKQWEQENPSLLPCSPEEIISLQLFKQTEGAQSTIRSFGLGGRDVSKERNRFFSRLWVAWDALAHDRIMAARGQRGQKEEWYIDKYMGHTDDLETVKLAHPLQVRLLDAMAEACGIPHQRGQTEIAIPKSLRGDREHFLKLVAFAKKQGDYPYP